MNLQESIRRILREETEYVKDVRVKISDILKTNRDGQSLDDAIVNVQDGLKSYSEGPPFLLKIGDKYEVLDGFHRIAQKILDGKKYIISDVMIKESNMNLQESIRRILREETEQNYIFVRTDDFDNTGAIRKLPYDGIHCWCIYEDDFDKYIEELELWGGSRKKVRIVDGNNYKKYAINYKMAHDYVMGDSDKTPELEKFNPNEHIMKFIKQGRKSMLNYVADMKYQIILI